MVLGECRVAVLMVLRYLTVKCSIVVVVPRPLTGDYTMVPYNCTVAVLGYCPLPSKYRVVAVVLFYLPIKCTVVVVVLRSYLSSVV